MWGSSDYTLHNIWCSIKKETFRYKKKKID